MHLQLPDWKRRVLFLSIILSMGMEVLDISIVNVSLVYVAGDLAVPPYVGTWIISSYSLGNSIMIILAGLISRYFGQLFTYRISIIFFTLFSCLCGLAPTFPLLVLFRILQGVSAGPMIPLSYSILLSAYPPDKRGAVIAIQSVILVGAPVLGPILGGIISEYLGWRWIFYINLPVGIFCLLLNLYIFDTVREDKAKPPMDLVGLGLIVVGVCSLQYLLDRGEELGWLASPQVIYLAATSIITLSIFVPWTWYADYPIVNLKLLLQRNFFIGFLCSLLTSIALYGLIVLLPIWLQTIMGYTAYSAGLVMMPFAVMIILVTPIVQLLDDRYNVDGKIFATIGFVLFFYTFLLFSKLNTNASFNNIYIPGLLVGTCIGLFYVPLTVIAMRNLKNEELPDASSLLGFIRTLGMGLGASIAISIMRYRQKAHLDLLGSQVIDARFAVELWMQKLEALGYKGSAAIAWVYEQAVLQTYMMGVNDFYVYMAYLFLILSILVLFAKKTKKKSQEDENSIAH